MEFLNSPVRGHAKPVKGEWITDSRKLTFRIDIIQKFRSNHDFICSFFLFLFSFFCTAVRFNANDAADVD